MHICTDTTISIVSEEKHLSRTENDLLPMLLTISCRELSHSWSETITSDRRETWSESITSKNVDPQCYSQAPGLVRYKNRGPVQGQMVPVEIDSRFRVEPVGGDQCPAEFNFEVL